MRSRFGSALAGAVILCCAASVGCGAVSPAPAQTSPGAPSVSGQRSSVASSEPSQAPAAIPSRVPLSGRTIVIDPGHTGGWSAKWGYRKVPDGKGGHKACNSSGTATRSGYAEHAYNFAQAKALAKELRDRGAKVVLTRNDDTTRTDQLCVNHRADLANDLKADLFISIHADGNLGKTHRGFHIIVSAAMQGGKLVMAESKLLAKKLRAAIEAKTPMPRSNYIGGGTGLSFRSDLGTLNFATRPAVMIEMGNMMNSADAKLFASASYRSVAAVALANGIAVRLSG